ncbi:cell adhesion protein [Halogeometricum borinquense]|uniref:Cell adhesion protein n=1 Tax=Halogeometricum borinquense TaxID=60847 RepID=A0A6C0UME3_9EURY|nr:cell adhesion protein [Halogeometricum borinquense]
MSAASALSGEQDSTHSVAVPGSGTAPLSVSDDLKINATENISVWQYSLLPLRAQTFSTPDVSDVQKPAHSIESTSVRIKTGDLSTSLDKQQFHVFTRGEPITSKFFQDGYQDVIDDERVQTVAIRLKEGAEKPDSIEHISRYITDSENTHARIVNDTTGEPGKNYFRFTPQKSGQYVFAVALVENGSQPDHPGLVQISDGDLEAKSNITIVGFNHYIVREGASSVSHQPVAATGSNISVHVDASQNLSASDVSHTVLLLNETEISDQSQEIRVNGTEIETIESSVSGVEGVVDIEDGTNILGSELPKGQYNGNTNVISLLERLTDNSTNVTSTGDTTLYSSLTSTVGGPTETVSLQTNENFSTGEYSIIHFATAQDSTETITSESTIKLVEGVQLNLAANNTTVRQGTPVTFTVTNEEDEPVANANVTYAGETYTTGADGTVTFSPKESATATVSKEPVGDTAYIGDSVAISVVAPTFELTEFDLSTTELSSDETLVVNGTVQNVGDFEGYFTFELKRDGQIIDEQTVQVAPGQTADASFDVTFDQTGQFDIGLNSLGPKTVTVTGIPDIEYSNFDVSSTNVDLGDSVTVSATVENNGSGPGEYNASFVKNGDVTDYQNGTLSAGESKTVSFTKTLAPGTYDLGIAGLGPATVTVNAPANLEYSNFEVSPDTVALGESITANATVENTGGQAGSFLVAFAVDDEVLETRNVSLNSGEITNVSFTADSLGIGDHTVRIGSLDAKTVTVSAPDLAATVTNTPSEVSEGVVPVEATVSNVGNAEVTDATVILDAQPEGGSNYTQLTNESVTLSPGSSMTVTAELTRAEARNYTVRVRADADDQFIEPDEQNNIDEQLVTGGPLITGTINTSDGDPAADDVVYSFVLDGRNVTAVNGAVTNDNGTFYVPANATTEQNVGYRQLNLSASQADDPVFERDGSPDIYALTTVPGVTNVSNIGTFDLPNAGVLNVTVVDQDGDPVEGATVTVFHRNNDAITGITESTTAQGTPIFSEGGETGIEVRGDVGVIVEPPEEDRFSEGPYTRNVTVSENGKDLIIHLAEGADLKPDLDIERQQRFGDNVTANVTVSNDGLVDVDNATVELRIRSASGETKTLTKHTGFVANRTDSANETELSFDFTDFAEDNLLGDLADGNARVTVIVDPNNEITETDEGNNIAVNSTLVRYADADVRVFVPKNTLANTPTNTVVFVKNNGTAPILNATAEVDYGDGSNTTVDLGRINASQTNTTRAPHTYNSGGDYTVTATVDDAVPFDNNEAAKTIEVKAFDLTLDAEDISVPADATNGTTFTATARFQTNYPTTVNATLELPDGLELVASENASKDVPASATGGTAAWKVRVNTTEDVSDAQVNVTTKAHGQTSSASTTLNLSVPKIRLTDTNATTLSSGSDNVTVDLSSATTYDHTVNVTVQAGSQGRTLAGLEYLFTYPYGCVEQTTSQMMGALRTDQYYRSGDIPNNYNRQRANDTIEIGVEKLGTNPSPSLIWPDLAQNEDGSWSMYGGAFYDEGDLYYTTAALQGVTSVANDEVQGTRAEVSDDIQTVNASRSIQWLSDHQRADGSVPATEYFLRDQFSSTGYTMVAFDRAEPHLNSSATQTAEDFRVDAAVFLIENQNSDGSWASDRSQSDISQKPQATALALRGLATVNESAALRQRVNQQTDTDLSTAIDNGAQWLIDNQNADGSWDAYRNSFFWSSNGEVTRATGHSILALNETQGVTTQGTSDAADSVEDATDYLVGVYDSDGSFGNTRATGVAINALTTADQRGVTPQTVDVTVGGVTKTASVDSSTTTDTVTFSTSELQQFRDEGTGKIELEAQNSDSLVVIGVESVQVVNEDEHTENN